MTNDSIQAAAYDVAVVGAGPAGSACATLLGRAGFRVLLCDRALFPRDKICGECINPKCWDSFDRLGVAGEIEQQVRCRIAALAVTNRKGMSVRAETNGTGGRPFFSMRRDVLDRILVGTAQRAGVEFRDGATVTRVAWAGRWKIDVRDRRRTNEFRITAEWLVGADGRNSTVASHLSESQQMSSRGKKRPADRVGLQWHTSFQPQLDGAVEMYLFDTGYGGLVNVDERHANVAMVTGPRLAAAARTDFPSFLKNTLWANPVAASRFCDLTPVGEITTAFPMNPRRNPLHHPHAMLIGDARQTTEPFTGEGILFALEEGLAAADRLIGRRLGPGAWVMNETCRLRVNRVFSPILRNAGVREELISLGARWPSLPRWVAGTVVPGRKGCG